MPVKAGQLNRAIATADLIGTNGNLIYIEVTNPFGQALEIKHINWGLFSTISPFVAPAVTDITVVVLKVLRSQRYQEGQQYWNVDAQSTADVEYMDVITGNCFANGNNSHVINFPSGALRIESGQSVLVTLAAVVNGAVNTVGAFLNVRGALESADGAALRPRNWGQL